MLSQMRRILLLEQTIKLTVPRKPDRGDINSDFLIIHSRLGNLLSLISISNDKGYRNIES
jgi:hypothetical protein